jgi:acetylornithine/succinyldiaminopimelate/putrescine aminotransferase
MKQGAKEILKLIKKSLQQLLGKEYMDAVIAGANILCGLNRDEAHRLAYDEVEFISEDFIKKMDGFLESIGTQIIPRIKLSPLGASTNAFKNAANLNASPVSGFGYVRLGEDGRLYLMSKSEHYHTPLGHNFPGYKLIDNARALGITNATHNNTRGYITRLLERELVRTINGIKKEDIKILNEIIDSKKAHVLNRVINLETGSLACEAGIKMMLSKFYKLDNTFAEPKYADRTPVFFVIADNEGGKQANYHGTTVIAQTMRDLWPGFYEKMSEAGIIKVCPVSINNFEDFKIKFEQYNKPPYKVAGFIHEIIMMNYGGIKLEKEFLKNAYALCHENDTPTMCDEIQSCMWYGGMFLFREYDLNPDFVIIGKGFPGGQYAASRIITTCEMDSLNQFGALVTNGQEELAALAYLITMEFALENEVYISKMGDYYEDKIKSLAYKYPALIERIEGKGHLSSIFFYKVDDVLKFTNILNEGCIDISSQTYKAMCPPAALTKPPIIATKAMIDYLINKFEEALKKI